MQIFQKSGIEIVQNPRKKLQRSPNQRRKHRRSQCQRRRQPRRKLQRSQCQRRTHPRRKLQRSQYQRRKLQRRRPRRRAKSKRRSEISLNASLLVYLIEFRVLTSLLYDFLLISCIFTNFVKKGTIYGRYKKSNFFYRAN